MEKRLLKRSEIHKTSRIHWLLPEESLSAASVLPQCCRVPTLNDFLIYFTTIHVLGLYNI